MPALLRDSVRNRLVLLFTSITVAALGFVYLYVVPQLSSSLTAERLERLEQQAGEQASDLVAAVRVNPSESRLASLVGRTASRADARLTVLGVREGVARFVIADSQSDADAVLGSYAPAASAIDSGEVRSGVATRDGDLIGETAVPLEAGPGEAGDPEGPVWVAVFSTPLEDVSDNVALIRRQIIIAGVIAFVAALLAAWVAANSHAKRLRRLEDAAELVAGGNFNVPIPIESNDEVGQLAMSFDQMQGRLARLDSARREFIANASHELRTPIASLGGFVELLDEDDPDPEARAEFVRTMRGQIDRLTKLTADLLDLSKLDADALQLKHERIDLGEVADAAALEFTPLAEQRGSTVEFVAKAGEEPLAQADLGRTMQIMRILVDNAIKHTPKGTSITITAESTATEATISVSDDGPGITPAAAERVFERFFTADSASGSGLGLAIARELALLMGGELRLASRSGRTTFTLELPRAAGATA
jgi:two-component system OmpR family sensor kinase